MIAATLRDLIVADAASLPGDPSTVALCAHEARRLGHTRLVLCALRMQARRPVPLPMETARSIASHWRERREYHLSTNERADADDRDAARAAALGVTGSRQIGQEN